MKRVPKIRQIVPRLSTQSGVQRDIVREMAREPHDQIIFAARRTKTREWVWCIDADGAETFYAAEIIKAQTQAEILVKHLNRAEGGDGGA